MNHKWQLVGAYAIAAATTLAGCATPKVNSAPAALPAQQLHNVARPEAPKSWLPNILPQGAKAKPSDKTTSTLAETLPADGKKHKPIDPLTMARLHERRGQAQQAVQLYEAELKKQPNNAAIHHRLAVIAARQGQWEKANTHFRAATTLDPKNAQLLCDCGYSLYLQHQLSEAEACLRASVELSPNHKAAQNNLGIVLGVQAKYDDSLACFRQGGTEAEAQANLGYVYMQLGDVDKAMAQMNHALSLDSKLRPAALALIQLNDLKRKLQPAGEADASQIAQHKTAEAVNGSQEAAPVGGIEIAARPNGTAQVAIEEEPTPNSHEPIDGSLTEYRFRLARQHDTEVTTSGPARLPNQKQNTAPADASTEREAPAVVQVSAQIPSGNTVSARRLTNTTAEHFPAQVHKPSSHLQQARGAGRSPAEGLNQRDPSSDLSGNTQTLSGRMPSHSTRSPTSSARPNTEVASSTGSVVVLPTTGDTPALLPQIRMPRPDEMLPAQSQLNQLPTHQLHPAAGATWTAPQTNNAIRHSIDDSQNLPPIRTLPSAN